ncbi:MAG TPA: sigma-70 family RNA polymerase sigma factor [Phycisphaerae bacterium]|nr:sigma-70 family RNA polymerase sigma factor [Phycisphaerae bacterium]
MLDFQRGRREAFALLVERNQGRVYALVYRLVTDHALAEDLTQEVFLRVFRTAQRYRPMARFSTWVHRIAANVALNAIRSRKKREMSGLDMHDGEDGTSWHREVPDERGAPPQADLDTAELADKLNESVAELPDSQRIAITLNKYEHMSYQEIADILNCSTMAVKSLLARARCNLRDALARYLGGEFAKNFESDEP